MGGENVTFYIDNSNCRDALVRCYTETKIINRAIQLFRDQVSRLGINAWFGLIPSYFNPSRAPTRASPIPSPLRRQSKFGTLALLKAWVESEEPSDQFHNVMSNSQFRAMMGPCAPRIDFLEGRNALIRMEMIGEIRETFTFQYWYREWESLELTAQTILADFPNSLAIGWEDEADLQTFADQRPNKVFLGEFPRAPYMVSFRAISNGMGYIET